MISQATPLVRPLHPLFQKILEVHGMSPRKINTTRLCAICGRPSSPRLGSTEGFTNTIRRLGFQGEKAHPNCIKREADRQLAQERGK